MLTILVVDDSLIIRKQIRKMVDALGHKTLASVKNGQEAVNYYNKQKVDLITMDVTMPVMDGITAVKEIIKLHPDAKIIMATSHGQGEMVLNAIKAGAVGYMLKPVTRDKLEVAISKVFDE